MFCKYDLFLKWREKSNLYWWFEINGENVVLYILLLFVIVNINKFIIKWCILVLFNKVLVILFLLERIFFISYELWIKLMILVWYIIFNLENLLIYFIF